jgi:hypothetical protein
MAPAAASTCRAGRWRDRPVAGAAAVFRPSRRRRRVTPRRATGKLDAARSIGDVLDSSARPVVTTAAWTIRGHHPATVSVTGCTDAIGNAAAGRRQPAAAGGDRYPDAPRTAGQHCHPVPRPQSSAGRPARRQLNGYGKALNRRVVITFG